MTASNFAPELLELSKKEPATFNKFKKYYTADVISLLKSGIQKNKESLSTFYDDNLYMCQAFIVTLLRGGLEDAVLNKNKKMKDSESKTIDELKDMLKAMKKAEHYFNRINRQDREILEVECSSASGDNIADKIDSINSGIESYLKYKKSPHQSKIYFHCFQAIIYSYTDVSCYISKDTFDFLRELLAITIWSIKDVNGEGNPSLDDTRKGLHRSAGEIWDDLVKNGYNDIPTSLNRHEQIKNSGCDLFSDYRLATEFSNK